MRVSCECKTAKKLDQISKTFSYFSFNGISIPNLYPVVHRNILLDQSRPLKTITVNVQFTNQILLSNKPLEPPAQSRRTTIQTIQNVIKIRFKNIQMFTNHQPIRRQINNSRSQKWCSLPQSRPSFCLYPHFFNLNSRGQQSIM